MDATEIAVKIWNGIQGQDEGGTFPRGDDAVPTTGFIVGGVKASLVDPQSRDEVLKYVGSLPNGLVGFWKDSVTGSYFVDGCTWVVNRGAALGLALRRGELAIWDVTANEEIPAVR